MEVLCSESIFCLFTFHRYSPSLGSQQRSDIKDERKSRNVLEYCAVDSGDGAASGMWGLFETLQILEYGRAGIASAILGAFTRLLCLGMRSF